jgi:mannose-6-phosphate isomerase-like protein (cupin superfamily)
MTKTMESKPRRRVVTGHNANGRAIVISDGPSPHLRASPHRPNVIYHNMWATDSMPVKIHGPTDTVDETMSVPPVPNGVNFRVVEIDPESFYPPQTIEDARKAFASMGNVDKALTADPTAKHVLMHKTKSVDYGIMLEGELVLVLDEEEVTLRAGDVVIQRGTNHAWANRSDKRVVIAFVLMDGVE